MKYEWQSGREPMQAEAVAGAGRFAGGLGRGGDYSEI
jgi:hypothetical protein